MGVRRGLVTFSALTVIVSMSFLGISAMASARPGFHHQQIRSDSDGLEVWTPTEQTFPDESTTMLSSGAQSLSCPAPGSCVLVGNYNDTAGTGEDLIDTLSGGAWTPTVAPLPPNAMQANDLSAVTCPTLGSCVAVGSYEDADLDVDGQIVTLSDGTWSAIEAPVPPNVPTGAFSMSFDALTCPAAGSCFAVGHYDIDSAIPHQTQLFVDTLSNGIWTATDLPLPINAGAPYSESDFVRALNCPAMGTCVAVGQYVEPDGQSDGLIDTLSDGTWTATQAPEPAFTATYQEVTLGSVACPALGSCEAIGQYTTVEDPPGGSSATGPSQSLIETLSDGTWTDMEAPVPPDESTNDFGDLTALDTLACPAVGSCMAAGQYVNSGGQNTALIETLDDGTWTPGDAPVPSTPSVVSSSLEALSCPGTGSCVAVGDDVTTGSSSQVLIETLSDGTWTPLQGPLPPNAVSEGESAQAFLDMLDCSSIDSCVSLGFYAIVPPPGSPFDMDIPAGLIETFGIPLAPSFSSVDQATFTGGQDGTFAITASGAPLPGVTEKGKLPKGLHFTKGKGSATIAGTPSSKKSGTYHLEIKASNSVKSNVRQTLTLTVSP